MFLVGRFLKIFSVTTLPNKAIFYREHLWKISSFHPDWTKNMGNSCFCLAEIWKIFSGPMNYYFVGMMYGRRSCTIFPYFVPIQEYLVVSTCISHFCPNLTFKQGYNLPYINIFIKFHTIYRLLATYLIVFAVVVVYWSFPLLNDNNQKHPSIN